MRKGWFTVSLRKLSLFPLAALLGAAVVVIPAVDATETPTIKAITGCSTYYPSYPCWSPETVTIAPGGTVKFESSTVEQGVKWIGKAPSCEPSVPTTSQKAPWSGSCTFSEEGTYTFTGTALYSYSGKVIVMSSSTGSTPVGTGTGTTGGSSSNPSGTGTSTGTQPPTGGGSAGPGGSSSTVGSLFVGSASKAVKLASSQHGQSVHGSVDVSQACTGGTLEVQLLATNASLASAGHHVQVRVGRVVHSGLHAGTATFTITLDAKAKRALHRHGHLTLTVKIVLSAAGGAPATVTRSVTLRG